LCSTKKCSAQANPYAATVPVGSYRQFRLTMSITRPLKTV